MVLGNYTQAHFSLQQALQRREELGDKYEVALSLVDMGVLEQVQGRYDQAIEYYLTARDTFRAENDMSNATVCAANLANIREDQGDYGPALALLSDGEAETRVSDNLRMLCTCLIYTGTTRMHLGDLDGAREAMDEALTLAREMDNQELLAKALAYRSALADELGDRASATRLAREAGEAAARTRDHRLQLIARLHAARSARSVQELDEVARETDSSDLKPLVAPARLAMARIHLDAGRSEAAQREAEQAIAAAQPLSQRDLLFAAHHVLGRARENQGDTEGALENYLAALTRLGELRRDLDAENLGFLINRPATAAFVRDAGELIRTRGTAEQVQLLDQVLAR
jgi:tetratricopeptide (TPR) repeat protein